MPRQSGDRPTPPAAGTKQKRTRMGERASPRHGPFVRQPEDPAAGQSDGFMVHGTHGRTHSHPEGPYASLHHHAGRVLVGLGSGGGAAAHMYLFKAHILVSSQRPAAPWRARCAVAGTSAPHGCASDWLGRQMSLTGRAPSASAAAAGRLEGKEGWKERRVDAKVDRCSS